MVGPDERHNVFMMVLKNVRLAITPVIAFSLLKESLVDFLAHLLLVHLGASPNWVFQLRFGCLIPLVVIRSMQVVVFAKVTHSRRTGQRCCWLNDRVDVLMVELVLVSKWDRRLLALWQRFSCSKDDLAAAHRQLFFRKLLA